MHITFAPAALAVDAVVLLACYFVCKFGSYISRDYSAYPGNAIWLIGFIGACDAIFGLAIGTDPGSILMTR
jgi:hypothetical protein